jgi:hypothetical protein
MTKTWTKVEDYIDTIDPVAGLTKDHPHDPSVNECIYPYCMIETSKDERAWGRYCGRGCPFGTQ